MKWIKDNYLTEGKPRFSNSLKEMQENGYATDTLWDEKIVNHMNELSNYVKNI